MTKTLFVPLVEQVFKYAQDLCICLEEDYAKRYPDSSRDKSFTVSDSGRKYYKILHTDHNSWGDSESVHAFVEKKTGNVYKPASWKAPAKHVRYNLLDENSRLVCYNRADWSGGYLYIR
tara:strand:- start:387 stop:743 length:357 start_codon:yes stop_codon:yes gene_type:complete